MEEKKKPLRRTKEGGVLSPGRPRKIKTEDDKKKPKVPAKIGRPKGSVDVVNVVTKNNIRTFLNGRYDDMVAAFDAIEDPYAKFKAYIEMMNFVYPKMRSVEFTADEGKSSLEAKMLVMINKSVENELSEVEDVEHDDIS